MNCLICDKPLTASDHRAEYRCTNPDCVAVGLLQTKFDIAEKGVFSPQDDPEPASDAKIAPTPAFWAGKGVPEPAEKKKGPENGC